MNNIEETKIIGASPGMMPKCGEDRGSFVCVYSCSCEEYVVLSVLTVFADA